MKFYTKKKTALVLGGGAARGLAHLGVLKVFKRQKIQFDFVIGTSVGALFAAIWARRSPNRSSGVLVLAWIIAMTS